MRASRWFPMALFPLIVAGFAACNNDDVSGTGGALARLEMDMPDTVRSGAPFDAGASAAAVDENVHDGVVTVTLPAPLRITDVTASPGTTAMFSNVGLATVTWTSSAPSTPTPPRSRSTRRARFRRAPASSS